MADPMENDPRVSRLRANAFLYQQVLRMLARRNARSAGAMLAQVETLAEFAWHSHPGRFADGALENVALQLGNELRATAASAHELVRPAGKQSGSSTLHVATSVYISGGHSRVLTNWMRVRSSSPQLLVLTRQQQPIPALLQSAWEAANVKVIVLDHTAGVPERAAALRVLGAQSSRVVLHQHPDDAVPVVAFARSGGTPVTMFNHAHFAFSLGVSVSDLVLNTLPYFERLSRTRRFAKRTALVWPITPPSRAEVQHVDKISAKHALSLRSNDPVAISIGTESYFEPQGEYDFFSTLRDILRRVPRLQFVLIGPRPSWSVIPADIRDHPSVRILGTIPDIIPYAKAADLVLESFPMPSLGAVSEAVRLGEAYPIPAFGNRESIRHLDYLKINQYITRANGRDAYVEQVVGALSDLDTSRDVAGRMKTDLNELHSHFASEIESRYEYMSSLPHVPALLPVAEMEQTEDDLLMAQVSEGSVSDSIDRLLRGVRKDTLYVRAAMRGHLTWATVASQAYRRLSRLPYIADG